MVPSTVVPEPTAAPAVTSKRLFQTALADCAAKPPSRRPPFTFRGRLDPRPGPREAGVPLLVRHLMMHALIKRNAPSTRWSSEPSLFQQRGLLRVQHTPDRTVLNAHLKKIARKCPPKWV